MFDLIAVALVGGLLGEQWGWWQGTLAVVGSYMAVKFLEGFVCEAIKDIRKRKEKSK